MSISSRAKSFMEKLIMIKKLTEEEKTKRVRAHKKDGTFKADDPATSDVNEAFVKEPGPQSFETGTKDILNPGIEKRLKMGAKSKDIRSSEPMSSHKK